MKRAISMIGTSLNGSYSCFNTLAFFLYLERRVTPYSYPCLVIVLSISCRVHTTRLIIFLLLFLVLRCMKQWINSGETQIYHQWDLNEAIDTDRCRIAMKRFSQTK
eukprot:484457_1